MALEAQGDMKLPNLQSSGIGTTGATGLLLLSGVIFSNLNPWWLLLAVLLIAGGIGQENRTHRFYSEIEKNTKSSS
jgi:hypothetical protein